MGQEMKIYGLLKEKQHSCGHLLGIRHSFTVVPESADARMERLRLNASALIVSLCPCSVQSFLPVSASHNLMVFSPQPTDARARSVQQLPECRFPRFQYLFPETLHLRVCLFDFVCCVKGDAAPHCGVPASAPPSPPQAPSRNGIPFPSPPPPVSAPEPPGRRA